jgi:hypothetical protein
VSEFKKCAVVDNAVKPCTFLQGALEPAGAPFGQRLHVRTLINMKTHKFGRSMVVLNSGDHRKTGIVVSFCPFCGGDLSSHLLKDPSHG